MIAHSKPIALPNTNNSQLAYADGFYTGDSNAAFNPASFTRHFLGSPISWRASSFSNRFSASPTAQLLSSLDVRGKTPMDDSLWNAVNVFEREGELCRNYTCCNLQLNDLHALLEHFEEVHIVVLDPTSTQPQAHLQVPFNPTVHNTKKPYLDDSDEMELDIDLGTRPQSLSFQSSRQSSVHSSPSPPDTPISTPLSNYSSPHPLIPSLPSNVHFHHHSHSPLISQPPSPTTYDHTTASSTHQNSPISIPNSLNLNFNLASHGFPRATQSTNLPNPEEAFNPYARFASDYSSSMPGALFNGATVDEASALNGTTAWQVQQPQQQQLQEGCVPPALLFSSSAQKHQGQCKNNLIKALSTTSLHRHHHPQHHQNSSSTSSSASQPTSPSSATSNSHPHSLSRPGSLLLCKPFRCPKPNCNKSYKQANGLKYHMTHGSCNFAPPKDLEHVKDLLERKRREREGMNGETENGTGLTRSASLGSAPAMVQHQQSTTTPSTPTTSGHPSPLSSTSPSTSPPPSESTSLVPSPQPSPPLLSSIKQNNRLSPSAILTYSDLSNISEHDLREVEREAERRLRPYACGIGECQRRYKNMNGLRYHYQHSGDHGALGLALLSNGQHECLSGRRNAAATSSSGSVNVSTPILGGVRNTSPTQAPAQSQVEAQAQAYHLQLQQFQHQQIRDQQQRQQQQQQQNQQAQQQQNQQHLANYHYAHMQRQYQAHVHSSQQAQSQQQPQQLQQTSPLSSPTHQQGIGLGMGMSVDMGLGSGFGSAMNGDSGMAFHDNNSGMMGMSTGFDNSNGMAMAAGSDSWMWKAQ